MVDLEMCIYIGIVKDSHWPQADSETTTKVELLHRWTYKEDSYCPPPSLHAPPCGKHLYFFFLLVPYDGSFLFARSPGASWQ